jgi:hypothetical protein
MATSWTSDTLEQAIKDRVEDQGTDFDTQIPNIIALGEDRILKDLPLSIFDARDAVNITAGTQTASKPTDCITILELYYTTGGARVILQPRTYSYCIAFCVNTTQAAPKYFAEDYAEGSIFIAPNPNLTVAAEALFTKRPTTLFGGSPTFLATKAGDLLLASCMIAAEQFNLGWAEAKDWHAEYAMALKAAHIDFRHLLRRSYATLAPQPMATGKGER